jgi:PAS domain S-box-containing protein
MTVQIRPPRRRWSQLQRTLYRTIAPMCLFMAAVIVSLLTVELNGQLEEMRSAPHGDVRWSLLKLEVDVTALETVIESARVDLIASGGDADAIPARLAELRRRYDILWSRVDVLSNGSAFVDLRRTETVHQSLSAVRRYMLDATDLVDGPDARLAQSLEALSDGVHDLRAKARTAAVDGARMFAVLSDVRRAEFASLLKTTAIAGLCLILALAAALWGLRRQISISNERGKESAQSRGRLAAAINASLDAIVVSDARGRIVVWNHAAEQVFGYSRATAIGGDMADLIVPPSLRVFHRRGMERYLTTGERRLIGAGRQETRGLRADGSETPVEVSVAAAAGENGPIFTAFIRDISDRLEADRALMRARDEAMAADRAKSEFIAVMSHEMRTPLNGVLGTLDLLARTALTPVQARYLRTAVASSEILLRHVNDVLDIARIEADRFAIDPEPFLPAAMLDRLALVSRPLIEAGGNRLRIDADLPDGALVGDARRIEQVLLNLLGNAAKFTDGGVVTLEAKTVESTAKSAVIEFAVRDDGPGVPVDDQDRIFEDFVTLDASYKRASSGTGLGLGICRRIVGALGGEIGVESVPGRGARFWARLTMPRTDAEAAPEFRRGGHAAPARCDAAPSDVLDAAPERPAPSLHVLVVEDNETNRFVVREMLTSEGHVVELAEDGQHGVVAAEAWRYDLILMDISMPGMDGVAATVAIREGGGPSAASPIIGITAHALPQEQARFRDAGMDGCLTKPLRLATLVDTLNNLGVTKPAQESEPDDVEDDVDFDGDVMDATVLAELSLAFSGEDLASLLTRAAAEIESGAARLPDLVRDAELPELQAAAHKLAGTAGLIGARALHDALFKTETACKQADRAAAQAAVNGLPSMIAETVQALCEIASETQHGAGLPES